MHLAPINRTSQLLRPIFHTESKSHYAAHLALMILAIGSAFSVVPCGLGYISKFSLIVPAVTVPTGLILSIILSRKSRNPLERKIMEAKSFHELEPILTGCIPSVSRYGFEEISMVGTPGYCQYEFALIKFYKLIDEFREYNLDFTEPQRLKGLEIKLIFMDYGDYFISVRDTSSIITDVFKDIIAALAFVFSKNSEPELTRMKSNGSYGLHIFSIDEGYRKYGLSHIPSIYDPISVDLYGIHK